MSVAEIQPNELVRLQKSGQPIEVIDVRMPAEFGSLHAEGAKNIPLPQLDPVAVMQSRTHSDTEPLYVICQMGGRSRKACEQFIAAGFPNVVNVAGGTKLWESQGLPVVRPPKLMMALDRQVRIAAGVLVVLGVALAMSEPVRWVGSGLAAFVGVSMVVSGVTNNCGISAILSTMPWNRPKAGNC